MAWKFNNVRQSNASNGSLTVTVGIINDDTRTAGDLIMNNITDISQVYNQVKQKIDYLTQLDAIPAIITSIPAGNQDPSVIAPVPIAGTPPTQAQLDFAEVQKAESVISLINNLKQLGWITGTETPVVNLKNAILPLLAVNVPKLYS